MKKILCVMLMLLFSSPLYAGIISRDNIISGADVTITKLNADWNRIYDEFNGRIDSDNIGDNTIIDNDLSAAIKFENWYYESLGDWTYTGHLPAADSDLTSDISAGTSFVRGQRIVTSATSHTYTASKDTWTYIDKNGTFQFSEVANGAAQPTTPANSLLLATVITDADNITSVTDHRNVTPTGLRVYTDYRTGCIVSYESATTVSVSRGEIELGSSTSAGKRRNTLSITLDITTDLDTGSEAASTQYFVWVYPDSDNETNFLGKISVSSSDATGITNERLLGHFWNDASSNISGSSVGCYKGDGSGVPNIVKRVGLDDITTTSLTAVPLPEMDIRFRSSGRPVKIEFFAPISDVDQDAEFALSIDNVWAEGLKTQFKDAGGEGTGTVGLIWMDYLPAGSHVAQIKWRNFSGAGTIYQKGLTEGARVLIVEEQ